MTRHVLIYNPVHGQRVSSKYLTIMGRVLDTAINSVAVYVNKRLCRRVHVSKVGAFECRVDLSNEEMGKGEVEVRAVFGHRTERVMVPFVKMEETAPDPQDSEAAVE